MLQTDLKDVSLEKLNLLFDVVEFKKKFYPCNWARYDDIKCAKIKLVPQVEGEEIFKSDFKIMKNMIFNNTVEFSVIIDTLRLYEKNINESIKNKMLRKCKYKQ